MDRGARRATAHGDRRVRRYLARSTHAAFVLAGKPSLWLVSHPRLLYPSGFTSNVTSQKERPALTVSSQPVTQSTPLPHGEEWPPSESCPGPGDFSPLRSVPSPASSPSLLYAKLHPILIYDFIFSVSPASRSPIFPPHQGRQLLPQGRDTAEGEKEIIHKSFSALFCCVFSFRRL